MMNFRGNKLLLCASISAAAISVHAQAAYAQAAPAKAGVESDADTGDAIVVTARRREESVLDVPISITALSGESLKSRNISTVADLQFASPAMTIQPLFGNQSTPVIAVRGFRGAQASITQDAPVAIYFADTSVGAPQGFGGALFDLQSVQVLKGPQGTLFGRNTTGGALLVTPNKPTDRLEGYVTAGYGNYNRWSAEAALNLPLSDNFKIRAAVNLGARDGFFHVTGGQFNGREVSDDHHTNFRLSAVWNVTPDIENYTIGYYSKYHNNGALPRMMAINPNGNVRFYTGSASFIASLRAYPDLRTRISPGDSYSGDFYTDQPTVDRAKSWGIVNTTTFNLGHMTLKNIFGYRNVDGFTQLDFDGVDGPLLAVISDLKAKQFSDEVQLQGESGAINWTMGLYYLSQTGSGGSLSASLVGINPFNVIEGVLEAKNQSYAAYGQATIKTPVEGLSVTLGARYTIDKRFIDVSSFYSTGFPDVTPRQPAGTCVITTDAGVPLNPCGLQLEKTFKAPTWTVSLDYKTPGGTLLYLAHRRGFRAGGFNSSANTVSAFLPFNPETVYDIEAGVKTEARLGTWRLRASASVYNAWYSDIQRTVGTLVNGRLANLVFNAAKARIRGAELEVGISPSEYVSLDLSYAHVDPKYTSFPFALTTTQTADFSDRQFGNISKNQFNAMLKLGAPLGDDLGKVTLTTQFSYLGSFYLTELYQKKADFAVIYTPAQMAALPDEIPGLRQKGYGLLDFRLDWQRKGLTLSAWIKNATNKYYSSGGYEALYQSLGYNAQLPGNPRTYGVEVGYRF